MLDGLEDEAHQRESDYVAAREQLARVVAESTSERGNFESAHRELEARLSRSIEEREELEGVVARATREREEFVGVIEQIKAEREERTAYTDQLEREIASHRELESSLKHMVVAAERIGNDLRALTEREATALLEEARTEARKLLTEASSERALILSDVRRIRAMLQAAQGSLDERALFAQWTPDVKETRDKDR
ncbi:MAG TPA: DivIVA domain-containing protein [Acidimicrobiales bacterium]|nr:DivIVA domain-containing protein [Acidimicrobiales bacterium]